MNKKEETICQKLIGQNYGAMRIKKEKVVPDEGGIYSIKEKGYIIYAGYSSYSVRKRLLSHLGSYDRQKIGKYLKKKNLRKISVSWVSPVKQAKCMENTFLECISEFQGKHPEFNKTRGDQCDEE